jgi:hypothetical protein
MVHAGRMHGDLPMKLKEHKVIQVDIPVLF